MKYYLCIVGNFEEAPTIYQECIERGLYQYYDETRQQGAVKGIEAGDVLILTTNKQLKGYGIASGKTMPSNRGHDEHWWTVSVNDGWRLIEQNYPLPYGVFWNTVRGTKQSIVKEMDPTWSVEVLLKMKRLRRENISEMGFSVHLSEIAIGLKSKESDSFYVIPEIQRGLVWNATRCEVLWDSILRGLPIGAMSLRPTEDGRWEIFDGQQRANTIAMGYADWRQTPEWKTPVLWIDLNSNVDTDRKFPFRVTTPAHPWGYKLSNDEKTDNRFAAWEQNEAVKKLDKKWERADICGARPYVWELWPVNAQLPVPFSILREYVETHPWADTDSFQEFMAYCKTEYPNSNWVTFLLSGDVAEPKTWKEIVKAVANVSNYSVVALNGGSVASDDLGLYFKRLNKQGIEPDNEEIQYSLLKAKIPELKYLDDLAKTRTRPAWLANTAIRFWLSQRDNWKWHGSVSSKDISEIQTEGLEYHAFIHSTLPGLLKDIDHSLVESNEKNNLLSWHLAELYRYGRGDSLVLYFLRETYLKHPSDHFKALATIMLWFTSNTAKFAEVLWNATDIQSGLVSAMKEGWLYRIFDDKEMDVWEAGILQRLETEDWGNGNDILQNPYVGDALSCIWEGFHDKRGCSFLLYACRNFIRDYFGEYNAFDSEWREQNRPWDYDHILPRNWGDGNRVSPYSYLVKKFLWSIGNSAPLPFSLNRSKNAAPPDEYYPDRTEQSARNLHVCWGDIRQFRQDRELYLRLDKHKIASQNFVKATLRRIRGMVKDWYDSCRIGELLSFDDRKDSRRRLFEALQGPLASALGVNEVRVSVWFVHGERQHHILRNLDWAQPWLACGICGTIEHENKGIRCLLGVASDGKTLEIGIRRHPVVNEIPDGAWWLKCSEVSLSADLQIEKIVSDLQADAKSHVFRPE